MSEHAGGQETKARRRLAEQLAEQKAAEAKRRRQAWAGAFAGIAVVAVLITMFVLVGQRGDDTPEQAANPPSAVPSDLSVPGAPPAPAPQLPEGADPALGTKPTVTAGKGELTKLTVTSLIEGSGPKVETGQAITTNYVGVFFESGEEFDSSWGRGEPATFPIGVGQVIPGWDKGLVGVTVGSRVQLDIPADQAYGDGAGGRPGGPLRFVVDVLAAQ
ncbi:FKBP-type peptidyl-prolyl cis-trans isomerase [Micromonospora craterilacus]|uniref:FKBP-type peptidyl-prolyl cis-trans isomerase n=1 Tax=Micromonospora craterilacus TaxID=1655439 RepID=UPI001F272676|nr:FKBP-type peptidyl-prolyl cis-trans isomerase [Micromonospora craterilacus]